MCVEIIQISIDVPTNHDRVQILREYDNRLC